MKLNRKRKCGDQLPTVRTRRDSNGYRVTRVAERCRSNRCSMSMSILSAESLPIRWIYENSVGYKKVAIRSHPMLTVSLILSVISGIL